jgi:hypothetical protein
MSSFAFFLLMAILLFDCSAFAFLNWTAGVKQAMPYHASNNVEQNGAWLDGLAQQQSRVAIKLISRRMLDFRADLERGGTPSDANSTMDDKHAAQVHSHHTDPDNLQTAICKVNYRAGMEIFRKDVSQSILMYGRAETLGNGLLYADQQGTRLRDGSDDITTLQNDIAFLENTLAGAERQAIHQRRGMWADERVRDARRVKLHDIDEFEQESKSFLRNAWEWIRSKA